MYYARKPVRPGIDSRWPAIVSLLLVILPALSVAAEASPIPAVKDIDRVMVVVNDDVITQTEVAARVADARKQLELGNIKPPPEGILRKQVLERMVLERIQLQLAKQTGIETSEEKVERAVATIAARNNMEVKEFMKLLTRERIEPDTFRNQIRNQLIIQQLVEREVNNRVMVSNSEVENFLENREGQLNASVAYNISHIMLPILESATPQAIQSVKKRIEEVRRILVQGEDFEQAAVTYSQGTGALQGGKIGWKEAGQLPDLFLKALRDMQPGDTSDVLRSPNGFHIIKLNELRGAAVKKTVIRTHVRHILLRPSDIQSLDEAGAKLYLLKERIENGEDFATLARAFSEDIATALGGGDLGWLNPGQAAQEFEKAMDALAPMELSRPVATPLGVHLIQVLERKQEDVSEEFERAEARQQIHARKADEKFEQWVRQLRDEAYVKFIDDDVN